MSKIKELTKELDKVFTAPEVKVDEAVNPLVVIQDLIDTNFSASEEEKGRAASMLKGLFFSEDPKAQKFIKELDKLTSSLDADDFK